MSHTTIGSPHPSVCILREVHSVTFLTKSTFMIQDFTRDEWRWNKDHQDEVSQNWSIYSHPLCIIITQVKKLLYYLMSFCTLMESNFVSTSRSVTENPRPHTPTLVTTTPEIPQFNENRMTRKRPTNLQFLIIKKFYIIIFDSRVQTI